MQAVKFSIEILVNLEWISRSHYDGIRSCQKARCCRSVAFSSDTVF